MRPWRERGLRSAAAALLFPLHVLAAPAPLQAAESAVILQYHHFGTDAPASTTVAMDQFRSHLSHLEEGGFAVWPVGKIVAHLREGETLPEKCVGITIDDAYTSVYEKAFPLLRERNYPFTVFVTTEGVDRGFKDYMTWETMRKMLSGGAAFAAHGHSHDYLVRRRKGESEQDWAERVRQDIALSVERVTQELGVSSSLFAYPYGEYDAALKAVVAGLGLIGFAQHSGPVWRGSDFGALPRFPMAAGYAEMSQFAVKVASLPLPVVSASPEDPLLTDGSPPPLLRLALEQGNYARETLACYGSGGERIEASWEDPEGLSLTVVSREPLPEGRSKYTCTARHRSENRWFWYSHLWLYGGRGE